MSHIYSDKKKTDAFSANKAVGTANGPSMDALRTGAAVPTREQLGRQVDLPEVMREKMESAFGTDLSAVKLYESEAVKDAGADAVAQGSNIAFAPGMLDFSSYGGQAMLGHEISHVVSQARGEVTGRGLLNDPGLEARADREGAMAASGQQISAPAEAISSVTAAPAAGPMQCFGKNKNKVSTQPQQPLTEGPARTGVNFNNIVGLKKGRGGKASSVAQVDMNGGGRAALKMGTNVSLEKMLTQFHNLAGKTYAERFGGSWNFNSVDVRGLTDEEKNAMRVEKLVGQKRGQLYSDSTFDRDHETEIGDASVFEWAEGKSRDEESSNPADPLEDMDYRRMMGYISMMDLATGNFDRLLGQVNLGNWTEERDKGMVHLIDNDYQGEGSIGRDLKTNTDRSAWLNRAKLFLGEGAHERNPAAKFIMNMKSPLNASGTDQLEKILGDHSLKKNEGDDIGQAATIGAMQALEALPGMADKLEADFQQKNPNGELDRQQKELIERMRIISEYSSDKEMKDIYDQLAHIGFGPARGEKQAITDLRQNLLQQIQTRRAQKKQQQG